MVKRTFSIPDEKEEVYERFKRIVPEVSGAIMEMIEGYVRKHEAIQAKMDEQVVFKGKHDLVADIVTGQEFRFFGIEIAVGKDAYGTSRKVYLTKKGKFLAYVSGVEDNVEHLGFTVYESYEELAVQIPSNLLEQCQKYLNINSNARTYIELDV